MPPRPPTSRSGRGSGSSRTGKRGPAPKPSSNRGSVNNLTQRDIETVLEVFKEMGGNEVALRAGSGQDYSRWEGLGLTDETPPYKRVNIIKWCSIELDGNLPAKFRDLSSLQVLHLYDNNLKGKIPWSWVVLTNLTTLAIDNNLLYGALPREIGNLTKLRQLFCQNNGISGPLPESLYKCTELRVINLSNNNIEGTLSSDVKNFEHLEKLNLSSNKFSGEIPLELGLLEELRVLELQDNCFNNNMATINSLVTSSGVVTLLADSGGGVDSDSDSSWKKATTRTSLISRGLAASRLHRTRAHLSAISELESLQTSLLTLLTNAIPNQQKINLLHLQIKDLASLRLWHLRRSYTPISLYYSTLSPSKYNLLKSIKNLNALQELSQPSYNHSETLITKSHHVSRFLTHRLNSEIIQPLNTLPSTAPFSIIFKTLNLSSEIIPHSYTSAHDPSFPFKNLVTLSKTSSTNPLSTLIFVLSLSDPSILTLLTVYILENFTVLKLTNTFKLIYHYDMPGIYMYISVDGFIVKFVMGLRRMVKLGEEVERWRRVEEGGVEEGCRVFWEGGGEREMEGGKGSQIKEEERKGGQKIIKEEEKQKDDEGGGLITNPFAEIF
ncbi:hypothetical protein TrVE_jg8311 [Triparma verrucosa]|uniref:Uncharacterized protein n=1 Tax=Triparma verrucosa TaxID=1606542 RepID=A0A9W7C4Q0_9STRA|nr:hypothetical protein TrVE_jg8311 [Triparma verrucosa]